MRTSKPFSTISYNTESFLKSKLEELRQSGFIDFYAYIEHFPEDDELKVHKHLYIVPSSIISTDFFIERLKEHDPDNPDKPLGCIVCRSSKFADWYMYGVHDKAYLASKGQSRKHYYTEKDFVVSDQIFFREEIHMIDRSKFVGMERLINAVESNVSFSEMVRLGQVPIQLVNQYNYVYECLFRAKTFRADRETHTPKTETVPVFIDKDTGEIVRNPFYEEKKKQERKTPASSEN